MRVLATALTIGFGLVTLLALLVGDWLLSAANVALLSSLLNILLQLVTITLALVILIGVVNLLTVHLGRVAGRQPGAIPAVVLILSFVLVVVTYVVQRPTSMILLEQVQVAIESALAALVLFSLVYGAAGVLRRRTSLAGVLFVAVVLVMLIGSLPLPIVGALSGFRDWLLAVPVNAGARGLLLGIALATLIVGVRVLIGQDRSYRE